MILRSFAFLVGPLVIAVSVLAEDLDTSSYASEIIVYGRSIDQVGIATSGSEGVVGYADFENRPINRVGELAENVSGLIATQLSGSGSNVES